MFCRLPVSQKILTDFLRSQPMGNIRLYTKLGFCNAEFLSLYYIDLHFFTLQMQYVNQA